jgi:hypothetical protein
METKIVIAFEKIFSPKRISKSVKKGKVYVYEYDENGFTGKRKAAAERKSDNICLSCGRKYLNSKHKPLFDIGVETGKSAKQGGWTFITSDLKVVEEKVEAECGLCGGFGVVYDYRNYNYLGLGDSKIIDKAEKDLKGLDKLFANSGLPTD